MRPHFPIINEFSKGISQSRRRKCVDRQHRSTMRSSTAPRHKPDFKVKTLAMCTGISLLFAWSWSFLASSDAETRPSSTCSVHLGALNTSPQVWQRPLPSPRPRGGSDTTVQKTISPNTDLLRYKWLDHGCLLLPGRQSHRGRGKSLSPLIC